MKTPSRIRGFALALGSLFLAALSGRADILTPDQMPLGGWTQYAGIAGGIPTGYGATEAAGGYTQFCDVTKSIPGSNLLAIGDGVADDTAAILAAINACPNNGIVYLPAGTYRLTAPIGWGGGDPNTAHPFIIRGAGPSKTKLIADFDGNSVIIIMGYGGYEAARGQPNMARGDNTLNVTWVNPNRVSDMSNMPGFIGHWVQVNNYTQGSYWGQYSKVTAVNVAASTVTFNPPIQCSPADPTQPVSIAYPGVTASRIGIEDLYFERSASQTNGNGILISGAQECWVKNVEGKNVFNWMVRFEQAVACEVFGCYFHDTTVAGSGGGNSAYGVGMEKWCSYNLVQNNVFKHLRHAMICEGGSMNVYGYNYSFETINEGQNTTDYLMSDLVTHGNFAQFNLFEGNVAQKLNYDNAEWFDGAPSGQYNTAFRNWLQRIPINPTKNGMSAVAYQYQNFHNNFVGNVLLTPGATCDGYNADQGNNILTTVREIDWWKDSYQVPSPSSPNEVAIYNATVAPSKAASVWHMNWDFTYLDQQTNPPYLQAGVTDTTLPPSYYLGAKPSWWDGGQWPAIGPDQATKNGGNPAMRRYQGTTQQSTGTTYTVTPSAGANGTVTPNTAQTVNSGSSATFTAAPAAGYSVAQWLVNGSAAQAGNTSFTLANVSANATVQVTFAASSYTVTPSAGSNGSIAPNTAQSVAAGGSVSFTASPAAGFKVNQWIVNGQATQSSGNSYTAANVNSNTTVQVTFAAVSYTVTPSAGSNGSIAPNTAQSVAAGGSVSLTASPAAGFKVNQWIVNGQAAQSGGNSYTAANVNSNTTVQVAFIANTYTVTPSAGANGSVSPSTPQNVASGSSVTFTASPAAGYVVNQWIVNGSTAQTGGSSYTTSNVSGNTTVQVTFAVNTYTVTPSTGGNGTISPSTPQNVPSGGSITFTANPSNNYAVDQWLVNGSVVQTGGTSYKLTVVNANKTVQVTFGSTKGPKNLRVVK